VSKPESALRALEVEQKKLPPLPFIIRYLDDFSDTWRTISAPLPSEKWQLIGDGFESFLDFEGFKGPVDIILKHWAAWALSHLSVATVRLYFRYMRDLYFEDGYQVFQNLISMTPLELKSAWRSRILPNTSIHKLVSLKSYLFFSCEMSLGALGPGYVDFIGSFSLPPRDKYNAVREGNVFLGADEEAPIVDHLDDINSVGLPLATYDELRSACILCLSYQYAMRPAQIAKVRMSDVKIYAPEGDEPPVVHITFLRAKQRSANQRLPMVRKIKREWSFIFERFYGLRNANALTNVEEGALHDSFFGLTPSSVSVLIPQTTELVTGIGRPANHLRHSAAQRLVDAGASQIELAEFMGHAYADTGLVYFDASPAQADRINKALALSPVYSNVAEVARTRTIDKAKLLRVAPDRQIGGVPHGIPIAGIGSCDLGQSLCSKNPVLSCYSCRKFMAVADVDIHKEVLQELRPIVRFFYDESRGETNSPAYMQLRRTLESVQAFIAQIDGDTGHA
jgi:integrase